LSRGTQKKFAFLLFSRKGEIFIEIRVFEYIDDEFIPRLVTYTAVNVRYKLHAYEPSDFSFDFPINEFGANEFKRNRFILIENFIGIIKNIKKNAGIEINMMNVSGVDIKGLLTQFIIVPPDFSGVQSLVGFDTVSGFTDECIKYYWRNNIGEHAKPERRLEFITIAENKGLGKPDEEYSARFNRLSDVTAELAKGANLVVAAYPQILLGHILLDVKEPEDRTASSTKPLIFSLDLKTVLQMEHIQEISSYKNAFYSSQSGNQFGDEALTMFYTRDGETEPEGLERYEILLNVSVETPEPGNEYEEIRLQAVHAMQNYEAVDALNAKTNFTQLRYGLDYSVGDFVTVQNIEWGVEADIQITAVEISESANGRIETVTLGTGEKGYIRQLRTEINNI